MPLPGHSPLPARVRSCAAREKEGRRTGTLAAASVTSGQAPQNCWKHLGPRSGGCWSRPSGAEFQRGSCTLNSPEEAPSDLTWAVRSPPGGRDAPAAGAIPPRTLPSRSPRVTPGPLPSLSHHLRHFQQRRVGAGVEGVQQPFRRARARLPRASTGSRGAAAAARGANEPSSVRHFAAPARPPPPPAGAEGQLRRGGVGPRGGAGPRGGTLASGRGASAPGPRGDAHPASAGPGRGGPGSRSPERWLHPLALGEARKSGWREEGNQRPGPWPFRGGRGPGTAGFGPPGIWCGRACECVLRALD